MLRRDAQKIFHLRFYLRPLMKYINISLVSSKQTHLSVMRFGLDCISNRILQCAFPAIGDSLKFIYKQCLVKNYFHYAYKISKLYPMLKPRSTDNNNVGNYKRIFLVSSLSTYVENCIHRIILENLIHCDLIIDSLSGFQSKYSYLTALIKVTDN